MPGRRGFLRVRFGRSLFHRLVLLYARFYRFEFVRDDRGAFEWVASARTPRRVFVNRDEQLLVFTLGEVIFWSSRRRMRDRALLAHELAHVRQARKHGPAWFWILYTLESWRRGYRHNRFERQANRAESRTRRRPT
jgi:hypothetical protein